jgi:hypothetical protein
MTTNQEREREPCEGRNSLIGKQVIHTLGRPEGLLGVQVRPLWQDHYRVNVLVGADAASAIIAHSYFVEADVDGNIIESTPKIAAPS